MGGARNDPAKSYGSKPWRHVFRKCDPAQDLPARCLPALWKAETTTQEERQTIARLLLDRVLVEVVHDTERVRVVCHWQGCRSPAKAFSNTVKQFSSGRVAR